MVILIARTIAQVFHQLGRRIENMGRRRQRAMGLGRPLGRPQGQHRPHWIWAPTPDRGRIAPAPVRLRAAKKIEHIFRRQRLMHRFGIGQADIFHRRAHQTAGDIERLLTARQHARQPVKRCIRIGTADRFMQRRDDVVMLLPRLVVERHAPLHHIHQPGGIERLDDLQAGDFLRQIEQIAAIAIRHRPQARARVCVELELLAIMAFDPRQQRFQRRIIQPAQHQHLGPRQQCAVQFKGRVFRGGADQHNSAVFHYRQETILLTAVETMNLVDEQKCALAHLAAGPGGFKCLLQIGDAGKHRRQLLEMQVEGGGQQPRDGGLAGARRPPQNDRMRPRRRDHAADGPLQGREDDPAPPHRPGFWA